MKLIVAEKPSVAANIAAALGAKKSGSYWIENGYMVTNCLGHLCKLAQPEDYDPSLKEWKMETLPILPSVFRLKVSKEVRGQFELVKKLMLDGQVESIINACDGDREGELIFRRVYNMVDSGKPVERLWVSSMEEAAILEGMKHLHPMSDFDNLASAAECRSKADWLMGINLSRACSKCFDIPLRVGRVQTPTINMVVQRELEIQNFIPVDYYVLTADFGTFKATFRCDSAEEVQEILSRCADCGAVVSQVVSTPKEEQPPKLYNLNDFQQDANKLFGATAAQSEKALQGLYERKLATYPRTNSRYLTEKDREMAEKVLESIFSSGVLPDSLKRNPNLNAVIDDKQVSGHPALLVTAGAMANTPQNTLEKQLLQLMMFRILEATAPARCYTSTKVELVIAGYPFSASGIVETESGWKQVEAVKRQLLKIREKQAKENTLPVLHEKDELMVKRLTSDRMQTSPPKRFTEGTLLDAMEKAGLGTPATRSQILESIIWTKKNTGGMLTRGKLVDGKWADTKHLYPTSNAITFMALLPEELKSPALTADWEKKLVEIAEGKGSGKQFNADVEAYVRKQVEHAKLEVGKGEKPLFESVFGLKTICACPICGRGGIVTSRFRGRGDARIVYHCSDRNCGMRFSSPIANRDISEAEVVQLCEQGVTGWLDGFTRKDSTSFSARLKLVMVKENGKIDVKFAQADEFTLCKCPVCNANPIIPFRWNKSETEIVGGWQCKNRNCALQRFYNPKYGKMFTDFEVLTLFTNGILPVPKGMSDRSGRAFAGTIVMERDEDNKLTGKYLIQRKRRTMAA